MIIDINSSKFKVKIAATRDAIQNGMMKKRFNKDFDGMLFLMGSGDHSFWMRNCIVPLDIIFIDGNEITKIHSNCEPCHEKNCQNYEGFGDLVLELEGGTCESLGIEEGDVIKMDVTR
jgi:uncharacterized membrane protein (UPF0127 family)